MLRLLQEGSQAKGVPAAASTSPASVAILAIVGKLRSNLLRFEVSKILRMEIACREYMDCVCTIHVGLPFHFGGYCWKHTFPGTDLFSWWHIDPACYRVCQHMRGICGKSLRCNGGCWIKLMPMAVASCWRGPYVLVSRTFTQKCPSQGPAAQLLFQLTALPACASSRGRRIRRRRIPSAPTNARLIRRVIRQTWISMELQRMIA